MSQLHCVDAQTKFWRDGLARAGGALKRPFIGFLLAQNTGDVGLQLLLDIRIGCLQPRYHRHENHPKQAVWPRDRHAPSHHIALDQPKAASIGPMQVSNTRLPAAVGVTARPDRSNKVRPSSASENATGPELLNIRDSELLNHPIELER